MMIINNRKDLDAAPDSVHEQFIKMLAKTINQWVWSEDDNDWHLKTNNTDIISAFDFTLDDFPDVPIPEKPKMPVRRSNIVNTRRDLELLPKSEREKFVARLASTINKYQWSGSEWVLEQDESSIARFDFTVADFPDAPVPEKPDYNPDEREAEQKANEVRAQRDALLAETDWTQVPDAPVDAQLWADYRQALRDVPQQEGFPFDINWPTKPQ